MNLRIESDLTSTGTHVYIDDKVARGISGISFFATVQGHIGAELHYHRGLSDILETIDEPRMTLTAVEDTATQRLRECAAAWKVLRSTFPPNLNVAPPTKTLDNILTTGDYYEPKRYYDEEELDNE